MDIAKDLGRGKGGRGGGGEGKRRRVTPLYVMKINAPT